MSTLQPDYDADPERWGSWRPPIDTHDLVAPELRGPVVDIACGEGRLAARLDPSVRWVGVDSSPTQVAANPYRPLLLADMRRLPFAADSFAEVTHLYCLYHLDDPVSAIAEAFRVLRPGGRYYACCGARANDPELVPEGYPPSTFDAEDAAAIVESVFGSVEADRWDGQFFALATRAEVRSYCRGHFLPLERADSVEVPLWLTKRGVLVKATKGGADAAQD